MWFVIIALIFFIIYPYVLYPLILYVIKPESQRKRTEQCREHYRGR